jgi:catechol 2,3-dioxygenase-like lactoylglutathione lyase family enzyme
MSSNEIKHKQIGSSLTVLLVKDLENSKKWYSDVLGCEVTDWWAIRDGLTGLAFKLLQAASPEDIRPNKPGISEKAGWNVYAYVENWTELDALYHEFKAKGATIKVEPWIYASGGPWKEFVIEDPDGYGIAFGGVDSEK